jgi:hypothetical protein
MIQALVSDQKMVKLQLVSIDVEDQMASPKTDIPPKYKAEPLEDADQGFDEGSEVEGFAKSKMECICPGCGKIHIMKMRWIGRGVPRKFCQSCRDRETPLDEED